MPKVSHIFDTETLPTQTKTPAAAAAGQVKLAKQQSDAVASPTQANNEPAASWSLAGLWYALYNCAEPQKWPTLWHKLQVDQLA